MGSHRGESHSIVFVNHLMEHAQKSEGSMHESEMLGKSVSQAARLKERAKRTRTVCAGGCIERLVRPGRHWEASRPAQTQLAKPSSLSNWALPDWRTGLSFPRTAALRN